MIFISNSPSETENLARELLSRIIKKRIVSLEGELGGGKTTFVKGVAKIFLIKEKIKSPTFFIMKKYDVKYKREKNKSQNLRLSELKNLYHFDCYRIKNPKEILDLGWKEIIKNPQNIVFVEWGDKIKKILPKNILRIKFKFLDEKKRKVIIY